LVKKIKSIFKGPKNLKIVKMHFWQKLKLFLTYKLYFSNVIPNNSKSLFGKRKNIYICSVKKIKSIFKDPKNIKIVKNALLTKT
jgi:hypothetical protein